MDLPNPPRNAALPEQQRAAEAVGTITRLETDAISAEPKADRRMPIRPDAFFPAARPELRPGREIALDIAPISHRIVSTAAVPLAHPREHGLEFRAAPPIALRRVDRGHDTPCPKLRQRPYLSVPIARGNEEQARRNTTRAPRDPIGRDDDIEPVFQRIAHQPARCKPQRTTDRARIPVIEPPTQQANEGILCFHRRDCEGKWKSLAPDS